MVIDLPPDFFVKDSPKNYGARRSASEATTRVYVDAVLFRVPRVPPFGSLGSCETVYLLDRLWFLVIVFSSTIENRYVVLKCRFSVTSGYGAFPDGVEGTYNAVIKVTINLPSFRQVQLPNAGDPVPALVK